MSFWHRLMHRFGSRFWDSAIALAGALTLIGMVSLSGKTAARIHSGVRSGPVQVVSRDTALPVSKPPVALNRRLRPAARIAPLSPMRPRVYTIRWGDTIWGLSQRFHIPISAIRAANHLTGSAIVAGARLVLPAVYVVKRGNTLAGIAQQMGLSLAQVTRENPGSVSDPKPGQRLVGYHPGAALQPTPGSVNGARAAQPLPSRGSWSNSEHVTAQGVLAIARLVQAEAGNQPFVGQVAVAAVVLNRVRSPLFPDTITGVIFSPGQFETVTRGTYWNNPGPLAVMAAQAACAGWDPTHGALYFYNPEVTASGWITSLPQTAVIADQIFSR